MNQSSMHCYSTPARTGSAEVVTSLSSTDANGDRSTATCPQAKPYGKWPECRILTTSALSTDFVYRATRCGNGIASIETQMNGQLTGQPYGINQVKDHQENAAPWHFNDTASQAEVYGLDYGAPYFSAHRLKFLFGDTANSSDQDYAHSTLASMPAKLQHYTWIPDGLYFDEWYGDADGVADQVIPQQGSGSPIPLGGWAVTENGHTYEYAFFTHVTQWGDPVDDDPGIAVSRSSIAYSKDGGSWQRLDANYPSSGVWWDANQPFSSFSAAAVYQPTIGEGAGYIYFFGFSATRGIRWISTAGMALMRVPATHASITNQNAYEYWDNGNWVTNGESVADHIIQPSRRIREASVTFNSYANRYMLLTAYTYGYESTFQLFQSESLTGPWTVVPSDIESFPYTLGMYAPFAHDRLQMNQGQSLLYLTSRPRNQYNAGLWQMTVSRNSVSGCIPGDP